MDKVMLITGTRQGIGRYLAEYYASKGYTVYGCSRNPSDLTRENYTHVCLDVTDEAKVKGMFDEIRKTRGRLDVLVNNAGISYKNMILLTQLKTVQDVMDTNVSGVFLFCREAIKLMKKHGFGRIVNLSTIHVPLGTVGSSVYSMSKAAIEQLGKVLAREVASMGITVNTLGLSFVEETGMTDDLDEGVIAKILEHTVLKEPLELSDVSHAVDFLISEEGRAVTSQTLYLGGVS